MAGMAPDTRANRRLARGSGLALAEEQAALNMHRATRAGRKKRPARPASTLLTQTLNLTIDRSERTSEAAAGGSVSARLASLKREEGGAGL